MQWRGRSLHLYNLAMGRIRWRKLRRNLLLSILIWARIRRWENMVRSKTKNKTKIQNWPSTRTQHPTITQPGLTTIIEEEESGDISSKTTTTLSAPPTQVDTFSATDDDNDDVNVDTPSVAEIPTTAGRRSRVHYQERNKALPSATISVANLKLDTVYGDHVHENSGSFSGSTVNWV